MMQRDVIYILKQLGVFIAFGTLVAAVTSLLFIDIHFFHAIVRESSLTEIAQEAVLLAIILLHALLIRYPAYRASSLLVAGFFSCMLVREMDFALDYLRHGSWFWLALAITLACLIYAAADAKRAVRGLAEYFRHPSYGLVCAGLLNVLVFSRLIGMGALWRDVLPDGDIRLIKNAAEEGSELFGYCLCLLGTMSYAFERHNAATRAPGAVESRRQV